MPAGKQSFMSSIWRPALSAALLMIFLLYIPTPFVVYEPGIVEPVTPMIKVASGDPPGEGKFMLTTVHMSFANFWTVARTAWEDDMLLLRKKDVLGGKTREEYVERLVVVMQNSQSDAVEAAYRFAGVKYAIQPEKLVVTDVSSQAEDGFHAGDVLLSVNSSEIKDADSLAKLLAAGGTGETLVWSVLRQGQAVELKTTLQMIPGEPAASDLPKMLGGVLLTEIRNIVPEDKSKAIQIAAGEIGGPSAGLMFALQMVDYLTAGDLSGGLLVAGTGTITPESTVGPIGGIALKVTAAHRKGAQLFLAPKENVQEAKAQAEKIGSSMRVEAAGSLQEAVEVLAKIEKPPVRS
ncbi:YlbL family protein [Paenibacillus abyssi]|uniref:endopeptidase La n=1 Tax=Paenibacillus abyssi TaxID=1340531 RepID=A0A917D5K5_9BACL|nr:S16 family serine protease [Paenibacillus abyssi]GGG12728.1 PDZ domain-containing protein [Paenibacillus abyssi]